MRFFVEKKSWYDSIMSFVGIFCFCIVCCIVCAQVMIKLDFYKNTITSADLLDGAILAGNEMPESAGSVSLKLTQGTPSEDIIVLVNGEEYDKFTTLDMNITIKQQSVIEILNHSDKDIIVDMTGISDNLEAVLNNESVTVSDIAVICRVIFR